MLRNQSLFLAIVGTLALLASHATGGTLNLSDQDSAVAITPNSSSGLQNWSVNGTNYANQQWFWYSIDGGAPASLDTLSITGSGSFSTGSGGTQGGYVTYSGSNGLSVKLIYTLTGGTGTAPSDLAETIRLTNTTSASHTYQLYQYSDFNLSGGSSDVERFNNGNTVTQSGDSLFLQSVVTPQPSGYEGGNMASPNTLAKLTGGSPVTLSNSPPMGSTYGPFAGGVTWAYEWSPTITAGGTYIVSSDEQITPTPPIVPEPSSAVLLLACGGAALVTGRIWRKRG